MSKYRKIDPRIWNDAKFRALEDRAQLVFFYLLTHPNMTAIGAMRASVPGLAAEKGWSEEAFREAFNEVSSKGMAILDERESFLWIPNFIKYNPPESPNVVKAWLGALDLLPECGLLNRAIAASVELAKGMSKGFTEALPQAFLDAMTKDYAYTGTGAGTGTGAVENNPFQSGGLATKVTSITLDSRVDTGTGEIVGMEAMTSEIPR